MIELIYNKIPTKALYERTLATNPFGGWDLVQVFPT